MAMHASLPPNFMHEASSLHWGKILTVLISYAQGGNQLDGVALGVGHVPDDLPHRDELSLCNVSQFSDQGLSSRFVPPSGPRAYLLAMVLPLETIVIIFLSTSAPAKP